MLEGVPDWVLAGILSAAMTWGAVRVELRWLRRDVDAAHARIDALPCAGQYGRRRGDIPNSCKGPGE